MARDPQKAKERRRRYLQRKKVEKYGQDFAMVDMRGRHGNHAKGRRNGRFNRGTLLSSHGYVLVRVGKSHPHAFGPPGLRGAYAYEHVLVAMQLLGRPLETDEVVHHRNGQRNDNRPENLEVTTRSAHARNHGSHPDARDALGRFKPGVRHGGEDLRVREWPA